MADQTLRDAQTFRPTQRRTLPWVLPLAWICIVVLLIVGVVWSLQRPTVQLIQLPEGGRLRFVGVTYGTEHTFVDGPRWQQMLLPLVGVDRARSWQWQASSASYQQPTLVCWLSNEGLPEPLVVGSPGHHYPLRLQVSNEQGSTAPVDFSQKSLVIHPGSLDVAPLTHFPRRGKWLYLDFFHPPKQPDGSYTHVTRIIVANPTPTSSPQWNPQPLPQAVRAGETTFLLKQFQVGVELPEPLKPWTNGTTSATQLQFATEEPSSSNRTWEPLSISFSNATGDLWEDYAWNVSDEPGAFWMPASLGREEAAWKLDVRFGQTRGFSEQEKWTFRDLPLPPVTEGKNVNRLITHGKQRVWLRSLIVVPLTKGQRYLSGMYQVLPPLNDALLTVTELRDERGRTIPVQQPYSRRMGVTTPVSSRGDNHFGLAIPAGVRRLDLTVALHRSRRATFLAAPEPAKNSP